MCSFANLESFVLCLGRWVEIFPLLSLLISREDGWLTYFSSYWHLLSSSSLSPCCNSENLSLAPNSAMLPQLVSVSSPDPFVPSPQPEKEHKNCWKSACFSIIILVTHKAWEGLAMDENEKTTVMKILWGNIEVVLHVLRQNLYLKSRLF